MPSALAPAFVQAAQVRSRSVRRLGVICCAYIAAFASAVIAWLLINGVMPSVWLIAPAALVPTIALALMLRSTGDARQYTMHMLAAVLALPVVVLIWADSQASELRNNQVPQQVPIPDDKAMPSAPAEASTSATIPQWPFYASAGAAHMLFFVGLILWGGSALTAVPALSGSTAVQADVLSERLCSLARSSERVIVSNPDADSVLFEVRVGQRRSHKITLRLVESSHAVQVEERLAANAAAPIDDDEASMGDFGESSFDAARPDAQRVWSSTWQATMIEPKRLAGVPLQLQAARALLPASYLDSLDGEGVLAVLCAVVTRSGWHWQPRLLAAPQRSSGRPT